MILFPFPLLSQISYHSWSPKEKQAWTSGALTKLMTDLKAVMNDMGILSTKLIPVTMFWDFEAFIVTSIS